VLQEEIRQYMNPASRLNGSFDAWIREVSSNFHLATNVSRSLLSDGKLICDTVDENAFRCLIESVKRASGVGQGVFSATLTEMPESFSRTQLKLWSLDDSLKGIPESRWQSVLNHALTHQRASLGLEIIKHMEARFSRYAVVQTLAGLDDSVMNKISVLWKPYADLLVTEFCNRRSYESALVYAGNNESLKSTIIQSIGYEIGLKGVPGGWPDLMRFMIKRSHTSDDKESIMNQFKSAGSVVVSQILAMDASEIKSSLKTDELRLMAFQWGLDSAVRQIDNLQAKGRALEHALGL
jgi:hypothetical protein